MQLELCHNDVRYRKKFRWNNEQRLHSHVVELTECIAFQKRESGMCHTRVIYFFEVQGIP